jgi:hypothetical protein
MPSLGECGDTKRALTGISACEKIDAAQTPPTPLGQRGAMLLTRLPIPIHLPVSRRPGLPTEIGFRLYSAGPLPVNQRCQSRQFNGYNTYLAKSMPFFTGKNTDVPQSAKNGQSPNDIQESRRVERSPSAQHDVECYRPFPAQAPDDWVDLVRQVRGHSERTPQVRDANQGQ